MKVLFHSLQIEVINTIHPVPIEEVEAVERTLGARFPIGYRDFVTRFGTGEFMDVPLMVLGPADVLARHDQDQKRLAEYWFWDESSDILSQKDAITSIACFDGSSGDDIRFLPGSEDTYFLLPHEDGVARRCTGIRSLFESFGELWRVDFSLPQFPRR